MRAVWLTMRWDSPEELYLGSDNYVISWGQSRYDNYREFLILRGNAIKSAVLVYKSVAIALSMLKVHSNRERCRLSNQDTGFEASAQCLVYS